MVGRARSVKCKKNRQKKAQAFKALILEIPYLVDYNILYS